MTFAMDDSFQFIIESPQHNQGHKKRPRLVTSCDNCRLKKIKCLQPSPEGKCEACKATKIPCRFRDRERYFAERSRAIAGPNASSSYGDNQLHTEGKPVLDPFPLSSTSSNSSASSQSNTRSNSHSPEGSGVVFPDNGRYQSYPPDPHRPAPPPSRHHVASPAVYDSTRGHSSVYGFLSPASSVPMLPSPGHSRSSSQQPQTRHYSLFDPDHPERPHPNYMSHFIQLFFEQQGAEYEFLSYEDILAEFWDQRLPPLLANCIAALAARYTNLPELNARGSHNVAESYADNAKAILSSIAHVQSMQTLHAMILLSWYEYKSNRIAGLRVYCQMAMRMAMAMGLQDQSTAPLYSSERERRVASATWASVAQLHMTAGSFRS